MRALIFAAVIAVSGCSSLNPMDWTHKMEIQQGNYVTQDAVAKLKPGMTRSQVRFLLGTPLLTDAFHADRWDYKYSDVQKGKLDKDSNKLLTVYFKGDTLDRVEGSSQPAPIKPQEASAPAQEAKKP
ncbi:outer membrane protein assembly factor BamE [Chromobacterium sp. IIBBL 290-4]|uniref:outer membrane protein assembly factor BamE n=1 Tax=Chromobacterium sp. IIBBL 290-4 TaxID=2953890 RepID=UPI0020B64150|nr:outer membrane protein assembly factor BamE [Chromobacterium sp. IIBBL 290-4]UTH74077.1 outer membrane protein assembly factor BamE [Chromobacterium sp. IIBBL 290-4]